MADADLAVIRDGTWDAEALQALADVFGGLRGGLRAVLDRDRGADGVCPNGVLESDGLDALNDRTHVDALRFDYILCFLKAGDPVVVEDVVDLGDPSFVAFKSDHGFHLIPCGGR